MNLKAIKEGAVPPPELRPAFDSTSIEVLLQEHQQRNADTRTPPEKLGAINDIIERFVFFKYYDGYKTKGEIGFNPNSGPPGSINHKRAFQMFLSPLSESQFREKGRLLANLAKEFIDDDIVPSPYLRPQFERQRPTSMLHEASNGGY
jgi:hypothetical protein